MKKRLAVISAILSIILAFCGILSVVTFHNNAYFSPDYEMLDLSPIFEKAELSEEDYNTLFLQTGLGKYAVASLFQKENFKDVILKYQSDFFAPRNTKCKQEAITTYMEYNVSENGYYVPAFDIFDAKEGYVLIMESSHSFGWRHGHAGIVTDSNSVLEAPIIGQPSGIYNISAWEYYTSFIMLRLKDTDDTALSEIAKKAKKTLAGKIYSPLAGVFNKTQNNNPQTVQCAYLVWYAFYQAGIDIDSNGDNIVTVNDIKNSDKFEIVQVYGYDPREFS